MYVNFVILSVTIQCVFSRNINYHNTVYTWKPVAWNDRGHRSLHQTVYFPNHQFIPNMLNTQITVQTGFHETSPINFQTIPLNWNTQQNQIPVVQMTRPNTFYSGYHHHQMPVTQQFHSPSVVTGQIFVENLNGKLEDFIKPDLSQVHPAVAFAPYVQPQPHQGGAQVHGYPSPPVWSQLPPEKPTKTDVTNKPLINAHDITTAPVPVQTTVDSNDQQENDTSNGDEQYDIDVRRGPDD